MNVRVMAQPNVTQMSFVLNFQSFVYMNFLIIYILVEVFNILNAEISLIYFIMSLLLQIISPIMNHVLKVLIKQPRPKGAKDIDKYEKWASADTLKQLHNHESTWFYESVIKNESNKKLYLQIMNYLLCVEDIDSIDKISGIHSELRNMTLNIQNYLKKYQDHNSFLNQKHTNKIYNLLNFLHYSFHKHFLNHKYNLN